MVKSMLSFKRMISIILIIFILVSLIMSIMYSNKSYATQDRSVKPISSFPASYRTALNKLPSNWTYTYFDTGLDWNDVIAAEVKQRAGYPASSQWNVIENKSGEWLCTCCDNSGRWKHVSSKTVAYYMDPRNFLATDTIFMFETLTYNSTYQTEAGVKKILEGTFMAESSTTNKVTYNTTGNKPATINQSYASIIMEIAIKHEINPYYLASRIKQEVVKAGGIPSGSATGTEKGYEGYYNFFNIKATEPNPIINGLDFAKNGTGFSTADKAKYLIPWTDPKKAIEGGAIYISENYIAIGQNSIYLQKFDVVEHGGYYNHQYMQNIPAPESEAKKVYTAYSALGLTSQPINFIIPVYRNMPANPCPKPSDTPLATNVTFNGTGSTAEAYLEPKVTVTSLKSLHPSATVTGAAADGWIGTGAKITLNETTYTAIKLGDVNGDGKVTASDYVLIKNHIMTPATSSLKGIYIKGGDVNRDGKVTASDYVLIKNFIMKGSGITV